MERFSAQVVFLIKYQVVPVRGKLQRSRAAEARMPFDVVDTITSRMYL